MLALIYGQIKQLDEYCAATGAELHDVLFSQAVLPNDRFASNQDRSRVEAVLRGIEDARRAATTLTTVCHGEPERIIRAVRQLQNHESSLAARVDELSRLGLADEDLS